MRAYTTIQGDMWDSIAHTQLGSALHADKIISLNRQYTGVYVFGGGVKLTLPSIGPGQPDPPPPWKQVSG